MYGHKLRIVSAVGLLASVLILTSAGCTPRLKVKSSTGKAAKICEVELRSYTYKLQREVARNPDNESAWELLVSTYWTLGEFPALYEGLESMMSQFPERYTQLSRAKDQYKELEEKYSIDFEGCVDRDVFFERYEAAINWEPDDPLPPPGRDLVFLEVSTVPSGAHIIVSDRYLGNSPVRTTVDPGQDITIQAMMQGYKDIVKVVNGRDLVAGKVKNVVLKFVNEE